MRRTAITGVLGVLLLVAGAGTVAAQESATPSAAARSRWTIAGGLAWVGGYPIGDATADLRGNATGESPPDYPLFRVRSSFEAAPAVEGRLGFAIVPRVAVEVAVAYARPHIHVAISDDREAAAVAFDGETASQYTVDVSLAWEVPVFGASARLRPFAIGGGGYLRQLHDGRALVETGQVYHAGGGARYYLRGADGAGRALGVRGDVQAAFRRGGIELEGKTRAMPTASVLLFMGF